jgi:hypothetical protein
MAKKNSATIDQSTIAVRRFRLFVCGSSAVTAYRTVGGVSKL